MRTSTRRSDKRQCRGKEEELEKEKEDRGLPAAYSASRRAAEDAAADLEVAVTVEDMKDECEEDDLVVDCV